MLFLVYHITHEDNETPNMREARIDAMFGKVTGKNIFYYNLVAAVQANNTEHAFEVMNLWDEPERVSKLVPSVRSLSVGDILVNSAGVAQFVCDFGFETLSEDLKDLLPFM